jgi:hypothetical protein
MPVTCVKVTMLFQDDQFGISESHLLPLSNSLGSNELAYATALVKARMSLMGANVVFVGARLSVEGTYRDSQVLTQFDIPNPPTFPLNTSGPNGAESGLPDQAKSCVEVRKEATPLHHTTLYLAGVPDGLITEFPRGPNVVNYPAWLTNFNAYRTILLGSTPQWGMAVRNYTGSYAPIAIQGFNNAGPGGQLGFFVNGSPAGYVQGATVQVRQTTRTNVAYPTPNGKWVIGSVAQNTPVAGQTSFYLNGSNNVIATTIIKFGNALLLDYLPAQYSTIKYVGQTTRKRGNRSLVPVARRRIRSFV